MLFVTHLGIDPELVSEWCGTAGMIDGGTARMKEDWDHRLRAAAARVQ